MRFKISILLLIFLLPASVIADLGFFQDVSLSIDGYYRVRNYRLWDVDADRDTGIGNFAYFTHELRLKPTLNLNEKISLKLDILGITGTFGNNPGNVLTMSTAATYPTIIVKRAYGEIRLPFGVLLAGRMPSHFGMGILSNDGDHPVEFGDTEIGNTYDRILFATKPLGEKSDLLVGVFLDKLVEGERLPQLEPANFSVSTGSSRDSINEAGLVIKFKKEGFRTGLYFLNRWQKSTKTSLYIPDFCLAYTRGIFHLNFELAYIGGKTSAFPVMMKSGYIAKPEIDVASFGSVLRVGAKVKPLEDLYLETGYASGDEAGKDAFSDLKYTQFSFDPNYKVGLLMFDFVERYFSAVKAQEVAQYLSDNAEVLRTIQRYNGLNEGYVNEYIALVNMLYPTHGSIRNTFYVFPVVKYRPVDSFQMKLGVLGAWVTGKNHRVETRHVVATSSAGAVYAKGSNYGWEVDLGLEFFYTKNASLGIQAGYMLPGDVFQKADGSKPDSVYVLIPRLTLTF